MQVYSLLDVLTARPSAAEMRRAPHLLYGHVHPSARLFDRRLAARRVALADEAAGLPGGRRSSSAAPGSISARWTRAFRRCPTSRTTIRERWRYELARGRAPAAASHPDARGSATCACRPRGRATASASCGRSRCWKLPADRSGSGRRARQPADRPRAAHASSSSSRDRPTSSQRIEARFDAHDRRRRAGGGGGAAGAEPRPCAAGHEGDRRARTRPW